MTKKLIAHPVADLFPMLPDDELAELAADIKERGLIQPVVLDAEGRILDGRNRLAACKLAGVEPDFTTFDGDDANGYALAVNIARRHLSTGARAVIAAKAARLNGVGKSAQSRETGIERKRIVEADLVLDWAPDHASAVIAGVKPLSVAVDEARKRKHEDEALKAKMARLQGNASDLLALVGEERMDVDDAIAALEAREQKAREDEARQRTEAQQQEQKRQEEQRDALALLNRALDLIAPDYMTDDFVQSWANRIGAQGNDLIDRTERAAQVLQDLAKRIKG